MSWWKQDEVEDVMEEQKDVSDDENELTFDNEPQYIVVAGRLIAIDDQGNMWTINPETAEAVKVKVKA